LYVGAAGVTRLVPPSRPPHGKAGDGRHTRSALSFAQLVTGVAVEVEAIFGIKA
jgi:hypothetical protein